MSVQSVVHATLRSSSRQDLRPDFVYDVCLTVHEVTLSTLAVDQVSMHATA